MDDRLDQVPNTAQDEANCCIFHAAQTTILRTFSDL